MERFALDEQATDGWSCSYTDALTPLRTIKHNDLFLVCDALGNVPGSCRTTSMGLFCADTRYLSRLEMRLNGEPPVLLSGSADAGFAAAMLLTNGSQNALKPDTIGIRRHIVLYGALFESIELTNYAVTPAEATLSLSFGSDFADLFEVRGFHRGKRGEFLRTKGALPADTLILAYRGRDGSVMEGRIQFAHPPDRLTDHTAEWTFILKAHQRVEMQYRMLLLLNGESASFTPPPATFEQARATAHSEQQGWRTGITQISSDNDLFDQALERSTRDLFLLRLTMPEGRSLAAGVPWFSTLFGRDALITASQTLLLDPTIARETLKLLAHFQGKQDNPWRDEQPGKILHEVRRGELARCREVPHTPYYGTIDATPLWLMLLAEYYAWTADIALLREMWPHALAAMGWIDRVCAGQTGPLAGYLAYSRQSERGLANQGWKDSDDCIVHADGRLATGPIALCEVQGYVYAGKMRLAQLAPLFGEEEHAKTWYQQAQRLKERFNEDFWLDEQDYCALALDGSGLPVDGIASNPGHCLHTGIFTREHRREVAERLTAPDLFSGWGIRTLHSLSPAFNPIGYHTGSVWPHDNSLIALGLRSVGAVPQMLEIGSVLFEVAQSQPSFRLPELFCGFTRSEYDTLLASYPVACSPQAWAAGSLFQILQAMVNLVPDAPGNCLRIIEPILPTWLSHLEFKNLRVGTSVLDLRFETSGSATSCRVANKRGNLRVIVEA
nr:amylo-alpha-1,6-glucosidase [Gloeobacter violaceus]